MSYKFHKKVRTTQPQLRVPVDRKWIDLGLVHAIIPVGGNLVDLVSGQTATLVASPVPVTIPNELTYQTITGSSQYGYFTTSLTTGPITLFIRHIVDSASNGAHISLGTTSGTERIVLFYGSTANVYSASFIPNTGGDIGIAASTGVVNNVFLTLDAANTGGLRVNGVDDTTISGGWAPLGVITRLYVGTRMNSTAGVFASQRTSIILGFNKTLSAQDKILIETNPWQVFSPSRRRVRVSSGINIYTLSISGGVVFSGATALLRTRLQAITGGISFSGAVLQLRTRTQVPSGGISFGGAAPELRIRVCGISGGVTFGGSAPITFIPAGGTGNNPMRTLMGVGT